MFLNFPFTVLGFFTIAVCKHYRLMSRELAKEKRYFFDLGEKEKNKITKVAGFFCLIAGWNRWENFLFLRSHGQNWNKVFSKRPHSSPKKNERLIIVLHMDSNLWTVCEQNSKLEDISSRASLQRCHVVLQNPFLDSLLQRICSNIQMFFWSQSFGWWIKINIVSSIPT